MKLLILIVAVGALVIALMAYRKAGGSSEDLTKELEKPLDQIREKTADTLSKMEKSLRKEDDSSSSE